MTRRSTGRAVVIRAVIMMIAIALAVPASKPALASSPSLPAGPVGGDPRSSGEGPGFVGDPGTAILVVLGIGVVSVVATYLYVRLTARRTRP